MKIKKALSAFAIVLSLSAFGTFSAPDDADAKRFGSSRSIGRTTTVRPSAPSGVTTSNQQSFQQQRAMNNNGGAAVMNRGGMFGGLLGGLLAGSLIGSLFSGHGFAGGGGFLDIIIIALIAFLGYKFLKGRRQNQESGQTYRQDTSYQNFGQDFQNQQNYSGQTGSAWDNLSSARPQAEQNDQVPASFNTEEFLEGAKKLYVRMQESWDMRDMNDIKQFTAPSMHREIEELFKEDPNPSKTELLLINASVLEVKEVGDYEQVAVLFDVLMKEQEKENNEQVKEIWNFSRNKKDNSSWLLDGIQQI